MKQEYTEKPISLKDVKGESSKAIFRFMVTKPEYINIDEFKYEYPRDLDDWERNRALLLMYPEWREKITEMSIISKRWENLVINWYKIELLYDQDCVKYGDKLFHESTMKGECRTYIRSLTCID